MRPLRARGIDDALVEFGLMVAERTAKGFAG